MEGEAQAVQQVGTLLGQKAALAQADEVTARAEDEPGAGLLLLQHLNPHLCFPLFLLGREETVRREKIKETSSVTNRNKTILILKILLV